MNLVCTTLFIFLSSFFTFDVSFPNIFSSSVNRGLRKKSLPLNKSLLDLFSFFRNNESIKSSNDFFIFLINSFISSFSLCNCSTVKSLRFNSFRIFCSNRFIFLRCKINNSFFSSKIGIASSNFRTVNGCTFAFSSIKISYNSCILSKLDFLNRLLRSFLPSCSFSFFNLLK